MNCKTLAIMFLIASCPFGPSVLPAVAGHLVVSTDHGRIDWSEHVVEAEGTGVPSSDNINTPRGRDEAFMNARRRAYQNLLRTVLTLNLSSDTTIRQHVANKDEVLSDIEGLLKTARIESTRYLSDGTVGMVMQMPLTGALSQLVLPETVIQLEMKRMGRQTDGETGVAYTGLVIDARGLNLKPALCFRVLDEGGQEVYGPAYVSREYAVQRGICAYRTEVADIAMSQRVGSNPLIVRGLNLLESGGSNIVISNRDALVLRSAVEHLFFLRKCNVLVITDSVEAEKGNEVKKQRSGE